MRVQQPPHARHAATRRTAVPSYSASVTAPFATANSAALKGGTVLASSTSLSSSSSHAGFESRILAGRSSAMESDSLSSYHSSNSALINSAESEERAARLRKVRRLQQQNAEWRMHFDTENEAREKERRAMLQAQDAQLADALLKAEAERAFEANERRRVCEGSEELAKLAYQLKAAQLNAERHGQLQQRQAAVQEEKEADERLEREAEKERAEHARVAEEDARQAALAAEERVRVLRCQMEEKEQARALAYSDFVQEKEAIDVVVQRLAAEDAARVARKRAAQEELQAVIAAYLREREQWRAQEQRKAEAELAAIQAYTADMERRRQTEASRLKEKSARDDLIYSAISREMERKEAEREAMERMLEELYTEQKEQEVLRELEAKQARAEQLRVDMQRENEASLQRKRAQRAAAQEAERQLQLQMQRQMEGDAAFEAANREKRARMKLRYQQDIAALIKAKQDRALEEARKEEQAEEAKRAAAVRELDIVEAERERLLLQLATQLEPYLPKGVYRDQQEKDRIAHRASVHATHGSHPQLQRAAAPAAGASSPSAFPSAFSTASPNALPASFPVSLSSSISSLMPPAAAAAATSSSLVSQPGTRTTRRA